MSIDKELFTRGMALLATLNNLEFPAGYLTIMLSKLNERGFSNAEFQQVMHRLEEINTYGKPPALAHFLQCRSSTPEITPERQAAIEWERVMDTQHTYICRDDHVAQTALPSCTVAVLTQYNTTDVYGNQYCGWYNLREDYRVAERSQKQWIRKGFIESWLSFYYAEQIAETPAIESTTRRGSITKLGDYVQQLQAQHQTQLEKQPKVSSSQLNN